MKPNSQFLSGIWYVAMAGRRLKPRTMVGRTLIGEPVLFGRRTDGSVFALRDLCPHRGMPLRHGRFDGETVHCPYHGWRFGGDGRCVEIPSLMPEQRIAVERIRCRVIPCAEKQGLIWIFLGETGQASDAVPNEPPAFPDFAIDAAPKADVRLQYDYSFDDAAFGLIDPCHVPFVHAAWWMRRRNSLELKQKEKRFVPCDRGWKTAVHKAPKRSFAHRLLGSNVATEIETRLPGLRIERITGDRRSVINLLAITPIDADRTQLIQCIWWNMRGLDFLRPLVERTAHRFLDQDREIATKHREGLGYKPNQMLIPDADTQMRWWLKLKAEWFAHRREGRPFQNPIEAATLRYRS